MLDHVFVPLPDALGGEGAHAMLSAHKGTDTAVVFVHGFGGHPSKTWRDFHDMVDSPLADKRWKTCDLYFFRYPSTHQSTNTSAKQLVREVRKLFPSPDPRWFRVAGPGMPRDLEILFSPREIIDVRPKPYAYTNLVIAGHSEGGFVIRRFALRALEDGGQTDPLLQARVRLFAPALFGAAPSGWLGALAEAPVIKGISRVLLGSSVAYKELEPTSRILGLVQDETQGNAVALKSTTAFAALLLWGEEDEILLQGKYTTDKEYDTIPGHNHGSICKPKPGFTVPLEFLHA